MPETTTPEIPTPTADSATAQAVTPETPETERPLHRRPARKKRLVTFPAYERLASEPTPGTIGMVVYLRRSKFHGDVADAIIRQLARIREEYPPHRYTIIAVYCDNDPASGDDSAKRKGYRRLAADLESGALQELKIAVWKRDRIDRRGWAQAKFVGDAETKAAGLLSIMDGNKELDAMSAAGKVMTAVTAALSEIESDITKVRVRDKKRATAEAGLNHGGQEPFGWRVNRGAITTHDGFVGTRLAAHPIEHLALKVAVDMVLSGHSLNAVSRHWKDELGIISSSGAPLKPANISRMLRSPRLMGYRMRGVPEWERGQKIDLMEFVARHREDVVNVCSCFACWDDGLRHAPGETLHRREEPIAAAEPVCDPARWLRLQQELSGRGGQRTRASWGSNNWLLVGLLVCGRCGRPLYGFQKVNGAKKTFGYRCEANRHVAPGTCDGVTIAGLPLERYVLGQVLRSLTDERLQELMAQARRALTAGSQDPRQVKLDTKRLELELLENRRQEGAYEGAKYGRYLEKQEKLLDEIDELEKAICLDAAHVPRVPASNRQELIDKLATGTIDQKRRLLAAAIEKIIIGPSRRQPGEPNVFRTERINVHLR